MKVYLHTAPVKKWYLRILGMLVLKGKTPVHCQLYWERYGYCFMTELTSEPPSPKTSVIARGNGFTIQVSPVYSCLGKEVTGCEPNNIQEHVRAYIKEVGPEYGDKTCNTYIAWLLKKICKHPIEAPEGAIGWEKGSGIK